MPERKLDRTFEEATVTHRSSQLQKRDHQDVTITSAAIRLPVSKPRPPNLRAKTRKSRVINRVLQSSSNDVDLLAIRFTFLSLKTKPQFTPPRPKFTKFALLPTEIRLMIWNFARPEERVIKLSASKKQAHGCPYPPLVSRIPVPAILHACSESRHVALQWYRILFRPVCGYGGTCFDTERDFIYYGPEERKLLVGAASPSLMFGWANKTRDWAEDRKCVRNIVVHYTDFQERFIVTTLLNLAKWCNDYAKEVLYLGPCSPAVEEGTLLSDMSQDPDSFDGVWYRHRGSLDGFLQQSLKYMKQHLPLSWQHFKPKNLVCVSLFATDNQNQNFGFYRGLEYERYNFRFQPESS